MTQRGQKSPVPPRAGSAGPGELHRRWQSRGFNVEQARNLLRAKCWEHGCGIEQQKNYQRARVRAQEAHLLILITHWPISYFCLCIYIYIYYISIRRFVLDSHNLFSICHVCSPVDNLLFYSSANSSYYFNHLFIIFILFYLLNILICIIYFVVFVFSAYYLPFGS